MAGWFFSAKGINDKERDPGWDEYFSSNRSTVESLVRESIQNSLDAAKLTGAKQSLVRIFYSGEKAALPEAEYADYLKCADGTSAADHYTAEGCGLPMVSGPCAYGQGCDWADDWKRFASENLSEEYPALSGKPVYDEQDLQDLQDWIDAVVESFVDGADLVRKMNGGES